MTNQKRPPRPPVAERAARDAFNGLCAFCGRVRPQIHHIDEDNSNNDPMNLIPLCPSHHLTDQHNPTRKIEPGILRLFRHYQHPFLLTPQFAPLYDRLTCLDRAGLYLDETITDEALQEFVVKDFAPQFKDLLEFMAFLNMGEYYARKIREHLGMNYLVETYGRDSQWPKNSLMDIRQHILEVPDRERLQAQVDFQEQCKKVRQLVQVYLQKAYSARDFTNETVVELLRYQNWRVKYPLRHDTGYAD